jgi:pyruvate dehydrogenase E1 component alpha subunit
MKSKLSKEKYLKAYEQMLLIRRFEEKSGQLYGMGKIAGFCHLYIGQEAIAVGMEHVRDKKDASITSYRDHGHLLAAGMDPKLILAELMGRIDGCSKGKGGSMHMFDIPNRFYGGHGIVGAQVPLGTGLAFAEKYRATNNISLTYFGDGAVNQGQVFEAFNMAALWKLPVLYIIENNQYSMGTSLCRSTAMTKLSDKGRSFGIEGKQVDAMDIEAVYDAGMEAAEYVRSGKGPFILEMLTYRYRGHSMSDPAKYRSKEEVEEYKQNRDPIENAKKRILELKYATEEELNAIESQIKNVIKETVEFCENSPEPDSSELYTDVYCTL